jgi:hypothetical protein
MLQVAGYHKPRIWYLFLKPRLPDIFDGGHTCNILKEPGEMRFLLEMQQISDLGYCQTGMAEKALRFYQNPFIDDLRGGLPR